MGNCKDCKHWSRWEFVHPSGICAQGDRDENEMIYIYFELGDALRLLTGPNFGCVLFEQKESE